ncbi:MAG: RHS repeat-associated core domain-containing protein [Limisphaerales bacterium]
MKANPIAATAAPLLFLAAWLLLPQTALSFYNASTGRWLSRDPSEEAAGPNLYSFVANNAIVLCDSFGLDVNGPPISVTQALYDLRSEGRAFRDPSWSTWWNGISIYTSSESGVRTSSEAYYIQTVWGFCGGLCNSGGGEERGSFITASLKKRGGCCQRFRISCAVQFDAIKYGGRPAPWRAEGRILGYTVLAPDTQHYDLHDAPYGLTTLASWDTMSKMKVKDKDLHPGESLELYRITLAVSMRVDTFLSRGFSEGCSGSCTFQYLGDCTGKDVDVL